MKLNCARILYARRIDGMSPVLYLKHWQGPTANMFSTNNRGVPFEHHLNRSLDYIMCNLFTSTVQTDSFVKGSVRVLCVFKPLRRHTHKDRRQRRSPYNNAYTPERMVGCVCMRMNGIHMRGEVNDVLLSGMGDASAQHSFG